MLNPKISAYLPKHTGKSKFDNFSDEKFQFFLLFRAVEEIHDDGTPTTKTFEHVPSEIGAEEAEEVGVEHLLRDIKDTTVGTLSQKITNQLMGLKGLEMKLKDMHTYLEQVKKLIFFAVF